MADCFSLPNAAELVEELKKCADCAGVYCTEFCGEKLFEISDFVEALLAENAKLKAELDAAIADINDMIKRYGAYCRYCKTDCAFKSLNGWCSGCREFEWRGVQCLTE